MCLLQLIAAVKRVTGAASTAAASNTAPGVTAQTTVETAQTSSPVTVSIDVMCVDVCKCRMEYDTCL